MEALDNPAWASLHGTHARFAERLGQVVRYPVDVAPFLAIPDQHDDAVWRDIAKLAGPGEEALLTGPMIAPPEGWEVVMRVPGVQLAGEHVTGADDVEAIVLGPKDAPEMLALIERTKPGPFRPRTVELGTYLGIRRGGALVAMAGERLHPPGWTEISAVCTDAEFRGQGLAARLVRAVVAGIHARGETPFLHTSADNANAIRLYESMGFRLRREVTFMSVRVPAAELVCT
jgi:ribosomal protein S18 acetylase RimI-like enzyme